MRVKSVLVFFAAASLSSLAATHRFRDSGHAIGMLAADGGKVRHAVQLEPGRSRYVLAVTGTVRPPYRGDAEITVEGQPSMDSELRCPGPAVDLGIRRSPRLRGQVLEGLQPKDRFVLWVVMSPNDPDWCKTKDCCKLRNTVVFRDAKSRRTLLEVPVVYGEEEACHGCEE